MGLRGLLGGGKFGAISRFGGRGGGGSFRATRSVAQALGLRRGRTSRVDLGSYNNYERTWDATEYMQRIAVSYLSKRPEYNPGWKAMVDGMIFNIKTGNYVYGEITKSHSYDRPPGGEAGGPWHSVSYSINWNENLENATNHPDLMQNYIDELKQIFLDYFESYKKAECSGVTGQEEWGLRLMELEKYRDNVEELMSESD
jgi:hypothetical protein